MEFITIGKHNLDAYIHDLRSFNERIFVDAFPDDDEREDLFGQIVPRIARKEESEPYSFCTLAKEDGKVCAGMISDWYPSCNSLEIIYIAVDKDSRRSGIGKELLNTSYADIMAAVEEEGPKLDYVFLEVDIPEELYADLKPMDPVGRLRFWDRMGAMRLPFHYTQPPLGEGKGAADNLMLLMLPQLSPGITCGKIATTALVAFLEAFYKGLGASDSPMLSRMLSDLEFLESDEHITLESIMEEAIAEISKSVITYHYSFKPDSLNLPEVCKQFNSFECDLMNYCHQAQRPFRTYFISLIKGLSLKMPEFYHYTSEGLTHYHLSDYKRGEVKVDVSISISRPAKGKLCIAHLSITPSKGHSMSDLDCIRLISGFGSMQERYAESSEPMLALGGRYLRFTDLLQEYICNTEFTRLHEGLSQFSIEDIHPLYDEEKTEFCTKDFFSRFRKENHPAVDACMLNKLLCGLILGIFDYHRMEKEEVIDTIRPIVEKNDSFMVLCRGHLMKLHKPDEEEQTLSRILISPYILIPSTALAINDATLDKCEELMDLAFKKKYKIVSSYGERAEMRLNDDYLEGIFEYESEKEIIRKGRDERGMDRRYSNLMEKISIYKNRKEQSSNVIVEAVLGIVAIFQIIEVMSGKIGISTRFAFALAAFVAIEIYRWYKIRKG